MTLVVGKVKSPLLGEHGQLCLVPIPASLGPWVRV